MKTTTLATIEINVSQQKNLARNLQLLLQQRKESENDVAQALNIPVMTVRRLTSGETEDPRISTLKLLANYFNVSIDSLLEKPAVNPIAFAKSQNAPLFVPILDWETAAGIHSTNELNLNQWEKWQPIMLDPKTTLSPEAFALESRPSMQPRFPAGTLFIIDPKEKPTDGDIILVRMSQHGELSLRELVIDPPKWQLQPIIAGSESLFYDPLQQQITGVVMMTLLYKKNYK